MTTKTKKIQTTSYPHFVLYFDVGSKNISDIIGKEVNIYFYKDLIDSIDEIFTEWFKQKFYQHDDDAFNDEYNEALMEAEISVYNRITGVQETFFFDPESFDWQRI